MKQRKHVSFAIYLFLLLQLATIAKAAFTCSDAINSNLLTSYSWTACYEASDTNIIGYAVGSLSSGTWVSGGVAANWDYNYNTQI